MLRTLVSILKRTLADTFKTPHADSGFRPARSPPSTGWNSPPIPRRLLGNGVAHRRRRGSPASRGGCEDQMKRHPWSPKDRAGA